MLLGRGHLVRGLSGVLFFFLWFSYGFSLGEKEVVELGEKIASDLIRTLGGELKKALSEKGPAGAVKYCNLKALPLTEQVEKKYKVKIKRTSKKIRNPKNKPDKWELSALEFFEKNPDAKYYVQKLPDGRIRFYKPLKIKPLCLTCHGKNISEDVLAVLKEKYPDDKARGYEVGDLRGVIRVEFRENN